MAAVGYFVLGCTLGGLLLLAVPHRMVRPGSIPGLSLVLSPLAAGAAMHAWGRHRRARGHATTNLATFQGGAALAFGLALVRYVFVR